MNHYIKGAKFQKAVTLAKKHNPELVAKLHEKWGDHLLLENQRESAVNHFVEAGALKKAVDASIQARLWNKAHQLL